MPNPTDTSRKKIIRTRMITIWIKPPVPSESARKEDNRRMVRISSITAAPSRPYPTRLRRTFNSISVWAEMETLVAASVIPKKRACCWVRPIRSPKAKAMPSGKTTPRNPEKNEGRRFWFSPSRCSSSPAKNIKNRTPNSPSSKTTSWRWASVTKES